MIDLSAGKLAVLAPAVLIEILDRVGVGGGSQLFVIIR